jgi:hypothetical protein
MNSNAAIFATVSLVAISMRKEFIYDGNPAD